MWEQGQRNTYTSHTLTCISSIYQQQPCEKQVLDSWVGSFVPSRWGTVWGTFLSSCELCSQNCECPLAHSFSQLQSKIREISVCTVDQQNVCESQRRFHPKPLSELLQVNLAPARGELKGSGFIQNYTRYYSWSIEPVCNNAAKYCRRTHKCPKFVPPRLIKQYINMGVVPNC